MRTTIVLTVAVALFIAGTAACKKEPGPACQQLITCCEAVKADTTLAATSTLGLCNTYLSVKHTEEHLCVGSLNDAREGITKASKTVPAVCAHK